MARSSLLARTAHGVASSRSNPPPIDCAPRDPDVRGAEIRVNCANLTRFTLYEPLWDAWCDSIRVRIRLLANCDLNRLLLLNDFVTDTVSPWKMASPAGGGDVLPTIPLSNAIPMQNPERQESAAF